MQTSRVSIDEFQVKVPRDSKWEDTAGQAMTWSRPAIIAAMDGSNDKKRPCSMLSPAPRPSLEIMYIYRYPYRYRNQVPETFDRFRGILRYDEEEI